MAKFTGISLSEGISYGKIVRVGNHVNHISFTKMDDREKEKERARKGLKIAEEYQNKIIDKYMDEDNAEIRNIMTSYLYMIKDQDLLKKIDEIIDNLSCQAEYAIQTVFENVIESVKLSESDYIKNIGSDLDSVMSKIICSLSEEEDEFANVYDIEAGSIIVAENISLIYLANVEAQNIAGIVTTKSGPSSHLAIVARLLKIPAISCSKEDVYNMQNEQISILDGNSGTLIVNPTSSDIKYYDDLQYDINSQIEKLEKYRELEGKTTDGIRIAIQANIIVKEDTDWAAEEGAEGIGLVRTETLFHRNAKLPSMEQQLETYREIAANAPGGSVVFRLFDFSDDKDFYNVLGENQSDVSAGHRGVRVLLEKRDMLKEQIKVILQSSTEGEITILIPFVTVPDEVVEVRKVMEEARRELGEANIYYNESVKLGAMIETPAAVLLSDEIADFVDILSIGTNDLTQYTLGTERNDSYADTYFKAYNPAVLRLIAITADAGRRHRIPVCVCGEVASDLRLARVLVGLGITQLSVSPNKIKAIKGELERFTYEQDVIFASALMNCGSITEAEALLAAEGVL